MEFLRTIDYRLFSFINQSLQNTLFDFVMPWLRDKYFWIPLYALLLVYVLWKFRYQSWIVIVMAVVTIVLTDQISASIIKPLVHRLRPCNNPELKASVHLLIGCGGGFSFVSSHAANHFGLALFLIMLLKNNLRWIIPAAITWAALVSFAQVYVGVHFPADVLAGSVLGCAIGFSTGRICTLILNKLQLKKKL